MATPLPFQLVREYGLVTPPGNQLWAIGGTADATESVLAWLDWMLAIIWPFGYDEPFRLDPLAAPAQLQQRAAFLRELGQDYPAVDVRPIRQPPGERVAAVATQLAASAEGWLTFERRAMYLANANLPVSRDDDRSELLRRFWSNTTREHLERVEVGPAARMLRVTADRFRVELWRYLRVDVPTQASEWERWIFR